MLARGSAWVHLAEVIFRGRNITTTVPQTSSATYYMGSSTSTQPTVVTSETLETVASANKTSTTTTMPTLPLEVSTDATVIVTIIFFLLLVGVVVVILVLWRCRHQHTAKEEASHTSSQTHTHPVVSLCEETGQVQHVPEQQDTDQDSLHVQLHSTPGSPREERSEQR